jgi:hypothetical protein
MPEPIRREKRLMPIERNSNDKDNRNNSKNATVPDVRDSWRIFRIMAEFVEGFEVMAPVGPAVSLFGSARAKPDDPMYQAAEETARLA